MPLKDALFQALVSHLNIEVPSPLVSLPETHFLHITRAFGYMDLTDLLKTPLRHCLQA